jgi:DNA-binding transcriptional regulator YiaG
MPTTYTPNETAALLLEVTRGRTAAQADAEFAAAVDLAVMASQGYLAKLRRLAGISQDTLAETLGCSQAAVSQWEAGNKPVDRSVALRWHALARALEAQLVSAGALRVQLPENAANRAPAAAAVPMPALARS